jgi:hypothetical protein
MSQALRTTTVIALAALLAACRSGVDIGKLPSDGAAERELDGRTADLSLAPPAWAVALGPGTGGNGIGVDSAGNVTLGGIFSGQVTLGSTTLDGHNPDTNYPHSPFVARLDRQGVFVWATGGSGAGAVTSLTVDTAGNSYAVGQLKGSLTLGATTLTATGSSSFGAFVAKLDPEGRVLWAVSPQPDAPTNYTALVALDGAANVYVASGVQVTKLGPSGNVLWTTPAASEVHGLAVDAGGCSYVMSYFNGSSSGQVEKLNPGGKRVWTSALSTNGVAIAVDSAGHGYVAGGFIARFSTSMGDFDWTAQPGGSAGSLGGLVADEQGNVYHAGYSDGGPISLGSTTFPTVDCGRGLLFIARVDASGAFTWATTATPTPSSVGGGKGCKNAVMALARDRWGGLYATGGFNGGVMTFGATTTTATEGGFVWKVTPP